MKLRIKGNSLRFRLSCSDLARLLKAGQIEETIRFVPGDDAKLTYALECSVARDKVSMRYQPGKVTTVLSFEAVHRWSACDQVGLYCKADFGTGKVLELSVEKDFACRDGNDVDNADTFPNPNFSAVC